MANILIEALKETLLPKEKEIKAAYERDTGHIINTQYLHYVLGDKQDRALTGGMIFEFYLYKMFYNLNIYKKFICNPILKTKNGTTEIDVIMITPKGIFVFEAKHYAGNIYGDVNQRNWLYYLGNQKHSFYNPIMQNKGHIKALMDELQLESKYFGSVVIFPDDVTLKIKGLEKENTVVTHKSIVYKMFVKQLTELPDILTNEQVDSIYNHLLQYCNKGDEVKQEHIEQVKENQNLCPRCGSKLVLRKSKTGNEFYGCSTFPKCRFTKPI